MAMKDGAGTPLNPANLWGKPDPRASSVKEETVSRKIVDEEHLEDDVDLDAELDAAEEDEQLVDAAEETADEEFADEDGDTSFSPEDGDEADESEDVVEEVAAEADADAELEPDEDDDDAESVEDDAEDEENLATDEAEAEPVATNRKRDMAEKKTSLSDHIRAEVRRRMESGASLRGKDIVEALARRNVKVSAAQVSQIMKKEGVPKGKPGRRPKAAAEAEAPTRSAFQRKAATPSAKAPVKGPTKSAPERTAAQRRPAESSRGFNVPMSQLQAAETFVEACGGTFETAERILKAAAQLSQAFDG